MKVMWRCDRYDGARSQNWECFSLKAFRWKAPVLCVYWTVINYSEVTAREVEIL